MCLLCVYKVVLLLKQKGCETMGNKNINVRIDEKLKNDADELYSSLGLSLSGAIKIFLKQSLREQGLPFELKLNRDTEQAFLEVENNELETFNNIDELWENLNAD